MYTNILQFAADHPWLAFFLAWPTALVIISAAWLTAGVIDNAYKLSIALVSQLMTSVVTLVRGYPPKTKSAFEELFGKAPEEFEKEEREAAARDGRASNGEDNK